MSDTISNTLREKISRNRNGNDKETVDPKAKKTCDTERGNVDTSENFELKPLSDSQFDKRPSHA